MNVAIARIGTNLVYDYGSEEAARAAFDALGSVREADSAPVSMASEWRLTRELADLLRAALLHIESGDPPEAWRQADWAKRVREFLAEEVALRVALEATGEGSGR